MLFFFLFGKNIFWLALLYITVDGYPHRYSREHMGYVWEEMGRILGRELFLHVSLEIIDFYVETLQTLNDDNKKV